MDRDVRIAHERRQLVAGVTRAEPLIAPVPGHADLVDDLPVDAQGPQTARDERLRADAGARAGDFDPVQILEPFLGGELWTDLDEHLRHELGEPRIPPAHRAGK